MISPRCPPRRRAPAGDFLRQRAAIAADVQQTPVDLRGQPGHFLEPASVPVPLDQVVFDRYIVEVRGNVFVNLLQVMLVLVLLVIVVVFPSRGRIFDRHTE